MVPVLYIVLLFGFSPGQIMAFEERSFIHAERRYAYARQAEVVRTIVVSRFRVIIGLDGQIEILRDLLHQRIDAGSLRSGNNQLLRLTFRSDVIIIQVKRDILRGNWRMLTKIF